MNKNSILITILFLTIGFATISTSLMIRGNTNIGVNQNDFNVYFSDVYINGTQDLSIVVNERELEFSTTLMIKNENYVVDYDVTNGSKNYDASLQMTCTGGNDYLSVNNELDTSSNLLASETRRGTLTISLRKQYTGDELETTINCTITATGVERIEIEEDLPDEPLQPYPYRIGNEIVLANENFNVIGETEDTVSLLAQYNLSEEYKQSTTENYLNFSYSNGWEYKPGPKEIDIQLYDGDVKNYINNYVSYLITQTGDESITGKLISLTELGSLGCKFPENYGYVSSSLLRTCSGTKYTSWLGNEQYWWTQSAYSSSSNAIWYVAPNLGLNSSSYSGNIGIRPVIIVSKDLVEGKITKSEAVIFCEEKGYPYGIMNDGTFVPEPTLMYPTDGNLDDAVYLCLQNGKDDYSYVSGYNLAGEQVYMYSDERLPV